MRRAEFNEKTSHTLETIRMNMTAVKGDWWGGKTKMKTLGKVVKFDLLQSLTASAGEDCKKKKKKKKV